MKEKIQKQNEAKRKIPKQNEAKRKILKRKKIQKRKEKYRREKKYRGETAVKRQIWEAKKSEKIDAQFSLKHAKRIPFRFVSLWSETKLAAKPAHPNSKLPNEDSAEDSSSHFLVPDHRSDSPQNRSFLYLWRRNVVLILWSLSNIWVQILWPLLGRGPKTDVLIVRCVTMIPSPITRLMIVLYDKQLVFTYPLHTGCPPTCSVRPATPTTSRTSCSSWRPGSKTRRPSSGQAASSPTGHREHSYVYGEPYRDASAALKNFSERSTLRRIKIICGREKCCERISRDAVKLLKKFPLGLVNTRDQNWTSWKK